MTSLFSSERLAIHFSGFISGGPDGISAKYLATLSLAVSRSISPANANTALLGP